MLKQKQIEEINVEYDIYASQVKRQQKKLTQLLNFTENHTVKIYAIFPSDKICTDYVRIHMR